jgi:hypothetical protein
LPDLLLLLLLRPAALAESVFDGVKAKMRNLRAALATKDNMLQALTQVRLQPEYMPLQTHHTCIVSQPSLPDVYGRPVKACLPLL